MPKSVHGHTKIPYTEHLQAQQAWIQEQKNQGNNDWDSCDGYGVGGAIKSLEQRVAGLLGKESAVFMPSGVQANLIALRAWQGQRIALQPNSHLVLHEQDAYSKLHGLEYVQVGVYDKPLNEDDVKGKEFDGLIIELPIREAGGQLPSRDTLAKVIATSKAQGAKVHCDGARLWETRTHYDNAEYKDIVKDFDSVYVSFYKGLNGLAGACLAGPSSFINEARVWLRRLGGNLVTQHPFIVSAAIGLDRYLPQLPKYHGIAQQLANAFAEVEGVDVIPREPHVNMFHMHVHGATADACTKAMRQAGEELGVALNTGGFRILPYTPEGAASIEIYVASNAELVDIEQARATLARTVELATQKADA